VLCFAPPETAEVPEGSLHPVTVIDGVVRGIADYGNKMGIPTVAGGVVFHPDYVANPLVYCGCLGILPRGGHPTGAREGDRVVVVGGRTGRDGLGGATFSSMEMDVSTAVTFSTAVQIGNPIVEKLVGEALLVARDQGLYAAVTDCGAGGLSSAVGEMAGELGAVVQLETVPTKYPGLLPWELWLSEAQERMVFAVADQHWDAFEAVFTDHGVEAVTIGRFGNQGRLRLVYGELEVADLATDFLHHGIPRQRRQAEWQAPAARPESLPEVEAGQALLKLLADPNLSSRQPVVAYYDSEVQGGTAGKPEPTADGSVLVPLELQAQADPPAAVLGLGMCPHRSASDPRLMAWMAVDEAVRNAVVKGADPDQIALLDNFCWGNPRLPDRLGALVRCCQGCYEASMAYRAPWVSGKDSLNNEFKTADGSRKAIPGTLLIHALGRLPRVSLTVPNRLQKAGNALYVVGETAEELGDSAYLR
ncbi:MAG: phosphoribosylformylglycinamidine synthase subunit PurL, partial [Candidatus Eremiobacteraeota bacterium]|nr:phosphoribosylformylglycinamidine synthase subunit PurL [Candidatus Eremiobacteraeota bacterium]